MEGRLAEECEDNKTRDLQAMPNATVQDMQVVQTQSSDLFHGTDLGVHSSEAARDEIKDTLEQAQTQFSDLTETVESQRDCLCLQVTDLQSDLSLAQEELSRAEGRQQAQQLSFMPSNEVARPLREQTHFNSGVHLSA